MKQFIVTSLQKALNCYLALDPESKQRLRALQGKVVVIELLKVGVIFKLTFLEGGVELDLEIPPAPLFQRGSKSQKEETTEDPFVEKILPEGPPLKKGGRGDFNADTIIKGTPFRLLHMTLSRESRQQFFADDVSIQGNIELGQQVIALFDHLEIDWEEHASQWIGDAPAHYLGRISRQIKSWNQQTRQTFTQDINEYVHEEVNLFPPREALQDFFQDVDMLRMDVDRLEAKLDFLLKKLKGK